MKKGTLADEEKSIQVVWQQIESTLISLFAAIIIVNVSV